MDQYSETRSSINPLRHPSSDLNETPYYNFNNSATLSFFIRTSNFAVEAERKWMLIACEHCVLFCGEHEQ